MTKHLILIISHRRSGTHLTIDSLINNFVGVSKIFFTLEQILSSHPNHLDLISVTRDIRSRESKIIKTHMTNDFKSTYGDYNKLPGREKEIFLEVINSAQKIYVVRDGRDVMVSLFHYIKAMRKYNLSFLQHLFKHLPHWTNHVKGWFEEKDVLILKYENLAHSYL